MIGFPKRRILAAPVFLSLIAFPALAGPGAWSVQSAPPEGGFLGVSVQDVTDQLREALDLGISDGVLVNRVWEESPAEKAGIEVGDVLLSLGGTSLTSAQKLSKLVRAMDPGHEVKVELSRNGKKRTVTAEIGDRPAKGENIARVAIGEGFGAWLGVRLHDPDDDLAAYFDTKPDKGALVLGVEEESPAAEAGLRSGDMILRVGGEHVGSSSDVIEAIGKHEAGDEVAIRILRRGEKKNIDVTLAEGPHMQWFEKASQFDLRHVAPHGRIEIEKFHEYDSDLKKEMGELKREMKELKKDLEEMKKRRE